jgi:large subunit ribosomal protein L5
MTDHVMRTIKIEKLTLNFGAGKDQEKLKKGLKLLETLSSRKPVTTVTNKRIANWGLRPGLPIGCKVTLRGSEASVMLKRLLSAKDFRLKESQFDNNGNVAFGVHEYIDIDGAKYDPEIGIIGLEACVTLKRPGFRLKFRKLKQASISKRHKITKQEAIEFIKNNFNVKLGEE